jgi:hypothetical protein
MANLPQIQKLKATIVPVETSCFPSIEDIMKNDDPRLIEAAKQLGERVAKYDERIVTVLKGHLATEQFLNELLAVASRRWKRRTYAGKIDVAKGLFLPDLSEELWAVLEAGNDLRNAVAHGHKEGTVIQRTADLRKALLEWASPPQKPGIQAMTDPQMISTAFNQSGSYIVVATVKLNEKKGARSKPFG